MNLEVRRLRADTMSSADISDAMPVGANGANARARYYLALLALDAICIVGALFFASVTYDADGGRQWVLISSIVLPVYWIAALSWRAYSVELVGTPVTAAWVAAKALIFAIVLVVFVAFYLKTSTTFSRGLLTIGTVAALVSLALMRSMFVRRAPALFGNLFNTVFISDGDTMLASNALCLTAIDFNSENQNPAMYDRLARSIRGADRVIVACSPGTRSDWTHALKGANVRSEIIIAELEQLQPLALGAWNGRPTVVVAEGPLSRTDTMLKRAFDLVVAVLALIVSAPVFAIVAALIKAESPGPVFFVQTRIGRGNEQFRMLKFRSMRVETSDNSGHVSAGRDDARITRLGRFIRRTSIDELPQLLNVLRGDMSIVGPRPHALGSRAEDQLFWEIDRRYWHRHAAKPGLTGLAQIRGYRGATLLRSDLTDRLQADLEYLANWSIWRDVAIVAMTFRVLFHRNAF